jgi:hypothetical protein
MLCINYININYKYLNGLTMINIIEIKNYNNYSKLVKQDYILTCKTSQTLHFTKKINKNTRFDFSFIFNTFCSFLQGTM